MIRRRQSAAHVDLVAVGECAHDLALRCLVDQAKPPIDLLIGAIFVLHSLCRQLPQGAVPAELDLACARNDLRKSDPPQLTVAVGIVRGHIERERQRALLEQGIGVFEIVAIAVVEGEADEAPLVLLAQPSHRLIERYDVEPRLLYLVEHRIEEVRRYLEDAIGRERLVRLGFRAHLVQGENEPNPLRIGSEQAVRAGVIKPRHRRLHHGGFHFGQGSSPRRTINH